MTEAARTMLIAKNLPKYLWAEAINTAAHVINRTGNSQDQDKFPYEVWFGKDIKIRYLKIFGTKCYTHIPKQNRKKWDSKAKEGIFVGYDGCTKGYRIWYPETNKIETHRDIIFESDQQEEAPNIESKKQTTIQLGQKRQQQVKKMRKKKR